MALRTEYGEVSIVNEPTYSFGSSDNVRSYSFEKNLDPSFRPASVHGILLNGEPLAVFAACGGPTGVNDNSALFLNGAVYLAVADKVVCVQLQPFSFKWALQVDSATCFGIHYHKGTGSLVSHGELEITRITEEGEIIWQSSGRDIFTGEFSIESDVVTAVDFNGDIYRFGLSDGRYNA